MTRLQVDPAARLVTGPAVPYRLTGRNQRRRWRFHPATITWASHPAPLALLEHDQALRVGRVADLVDTSDCLVASLRIARGPAGDRVLARAAAGQLWMSVGLAAEGLAWFAEPGTGVRDVTAAVLTEVSLTRTPVYLPSLEEEAAGGPGR